MDKHEKPILYTYFRSSSAARVRIALNFKGVDYEPRHINLLKSEQQSAEYLAHSPSGLVPLLVVGNEEIMQSVAILEYLEETYQNKPLLPKDPSKRAQVRAIVGTICSDIQPLQNLRVLRTIPEQERQEYARRIIGQGLAVVEKMLERTAGSFCVGDDVTLADCCLIPQLYNAYRFGVDFSDMPLIRAIDERASELEPFKKAHWTQQPDCPVELGK